MTNDEIKAQAIADVSRAAESHPINMLAGSYAYAVAQREQNIRFKLATEEFLRVYDQAYDDTTIDKAIDVLRKLVKVQAAPEKEE
jgi:hypothetical protein